MQKFSLFINNPNIFKKKDRFGQRDIDTFRIVFSKESYKQSNTLEDDWYQHISPKSIID